MTYLKIIGIIITGTIIYFLGLIPLVGFIRMEIQNKIDHQKRYMTYREYFIEGFLISWISTCMIAGICLIIFG